YAERIRDLNTQITTAYATASQHAPNDLLDQRDQLVSELSQLVSVNVIEQDSSFSLTVGNGQILLGGDTVFPLHAQPSADDPARTVVAYSAPGPNGTTLKVELDEDRIKGGTLGGLIAYRRDALDTVQNSLGRLAVGLATAVNELHKQGEDLNGVGGSDFFNLGKVQPIPGSRNQGAAILNVELTDANQLTGQDYRVERTATGYTVTSVPNGTVTALTGTNGTVDGVTFDFTGGAPAVGDSWLVQPTRAAGATLSLAINDPAKIAASAPGTGTANGDNALALAGLQTKKLLGNGAMSLNESFSDRKSTRLNSSHVKSRM